MALHCIRKIPHSPQSQQFPSESTQLPRHTAKHSNEPRWMLCSTEMASKAQYQAGDSEAAGCSLQQRANEKLMLPYAFVTMISEEHGLTALASKSSPI